MSASAEEVIAGVRGWDKMVIGTPAAARILAALRAAGYVVERDWQDISTAPRDGTEVQLWCSPHSENELDSIFTAAWTVDDDEDEGAWILPLPDDKEGGWGDALRWEPTHWRPLPAPPDAT